MVFFGENMLRNTIKQYLEHYRKERNHQGLENTIIDPENEVGQIAGEVKMHRAAGQDAAVLLQRRSVTTTGRWQSENPPSQPVRAGIATTFHNRVR